MTNSLEEKLPLGTHLRSAARSFRMSLFSPLFGAPAALLRQRRCPIKGLRAESLLIYRNFLAPGTTEACLSNLFHWHFQCS
jgi:hypothetical protein